MGGEGKEENRGKDLPDIEKFQGMLMKSNFAAKFADAILFTVQQSEEWSAFFNEAGISSDFAQQVAEKLP